MSADTVNYVPSSFDEAVVGESYHIAQDWETARAVRARAKKADAEVFLSDKWVSNFDERWLTIPEKQMEIRYDPNSSAPLVDEEGNYLLIKTVTRLAKEISELDKVVYNDFIKKMFSTFEEYLYTVSWFSREVTQARSNSKFLEIQVKDEDGNNLVDDQGNNVMYTLGFIDINRIRALAASAIKRGMGYIRNTKKASRKNSEPSKFTSVYKAVRVSPAFQVLLKGLNEYMYRVHESNSANWSDTARDKYVSMYRTFQDGGLTDQLLESPILQKMACSNVLYIISYIASIDKTPTLLALDGVNNMRTTRGVELNDETLSSWKLEELVAEKKKLSAGTFDTPSLLLDAMKGVSTIHFEKAGGSSSLLIAKENVDDRNTIVKVMRSAGLYTGKKFDENAIPMNLMGRLLSTFIYKENIKKADLTKLVRERGERFLEGVVGLTLKSGEMLKLAHDVAYATNKYARKYRKLIDKHILRLKRAKRSNDSLNGIRESKREVLSPLRF